MPPRTRTRSTKVLKENIEAVKKSKVKSDGKVTKSSRKALADKTNSLSDDNASIDIPIKASKKTLNSKDTKPNGGNEGRPRRQRRLPPRYIENQTLKDLSNSRDSLVKHSTITSETETPTKITPAKELPTKTIQDVVDVIRPETHTEIPLKVSKNKPVSKSDKSKKNTDQVSITKYLTKDATRPRRNCRMQSAVDNPPISNSLNVSSPFKTPTKDTENSLVANKPKRVCRLPSRFEDHSISPNKFIPVQPTYASTPLQKTTKVVSRIAQNVGKENDPKTKKAKMISKLIPKATTSKPTNTASTSNSSTDHNSPDTNNNGKKKILRPKKATDKTKLLTTKQTSPNNKVKPFTKRLLEKSLSFRVLEDRKSNEKCQDVYEFTFDPNDEPPQKKKRKKPVKKRAPKPKSVVFKSNYTDNVSKTLANLKTKVKPSQTKLVGNIVKPTENQVKPIENHKLTENSKPSTAENVQNMQSIVKPPTSDIPQSNYSANITPLPPAINESVNSIHTSNYASIRVEDIAADFEFSDHHSEINYSPVNSPDHRPTPEPQTIPQVSEPSKSEAPVHNKDPLNLQDSSFFEVPPIASSSMNVSVPHPLASPWRAEFGALPIKWHSNTYVKPNMTPAVESSFINSEVTNKKHVYTNIVAEDEPIPEIFGNAPALKQPSILSFFKEVVERNANKKKRRHSLTSTRPIFDDVTGNSNEAYKSPKKAKLTKDSTPNTSNNTNDTSKDKENPSDTSNKTLSPVKKKKEKDCTYFGFDESENIDQENVSPVKIKSNPKTRVLRSRNVLKELNAQPMPTRAAIPVSAKGLLTSSEVVEKLYDQVKSAENAQLPVKETAKDLADNTVATNVDDPSWCEDNEDSQSVHLFEDIDVVHHLKPHRKSYGKAKKVTFQQSEGSNSDSHPVRAVLESSDDDDLADLSFRLPAVKQTNRTKKKKPKKPMTKKEEKEVEEWAAGFNSMCDDIDEFHLLVE